MTARGYKFFAWAFLGGAALALFENTSVAQVFGMVTVSCVFYAAGDILKAVSK